MCAERGRAVLVQREMERRRSVVVSVVPMVGLDFREYQDCSERHTGGLAPSGDWPVQNWLGGYDIEKYA